MWSRGPEANKHIDRRSVTLFDHETDVYKADPNKLLEEAGIKVESYTCYPHQLVVRRKTLRAAGVRVEDVVLV